MRSERNVGVGSLTVRNRKRIRSAMQVIMRYWRGGKLGPSEAVSSAAALSFQPGMIRATAR
jgi:hypothetical protein